jgi:hypothetical protein
MVAAPTGCFRTRSGRIDGEATGRCMTKMREIGQHLGDAAADVTHALAHWREGDLADAFRLVVRARLSLAAAQGALTRVGAEDVLLVRGPSPHKSPSEQGGAPA